MISKLKLFKFHVPLFDYFDFKGEHGRQVHTKMDMNEITSNGRRKSYSREFKFGVVNGIKIMEKLIFRLQINIDKIGRKQAHNWVKNEGNISDQK